MIDLDIASDAIFSSDGIYRFALWRVWNRDLPIRMQIGLNPSKAGRIYNDPTIARGITRAYRDGFGGFLMGNLYGYISTDPNELIGEDCIGEDNDYYLREMIGLSDQVVIGWGSFKQAHRRSGEVLQMIEAPYCLGVNQDGQPQHPLYAAYNIQVFRYG